MMVCDDPRFVLYMPQKCGTGAVTQTLKERFVCRWEGHYHAAHPLVEDWEDRFHALLVRDPFARAVSWWGFHRRSEVPERRHGTHRHRQHLAAARRTFREWCLDQACIRQLLPCTHWLDAMPRVDAVLRCETLAADFAGLPFVDFPLTGSWRNTGGVENWRAEYDEETAAVIRTRCAPDFDLFDYDPDPFRATA